MKILHVIPSYLPSRHYGGGPVVVEALASCQAREGHDVAVLTTDALDETHRVAERTARRDGVTVHYVPTLSNSLAYRQKIFLTPRFTRPFADRLAQLDVAHLHDYRTFQNLSIARACRAVGVPYVLQAHGAANVTGKGAAKRLFDTVSGRRLVRGAALCLALNDTEAESYRKLGADPSRIRLVANGIDADVVQHPPGRDGSFRARLGLECDAFLVLYTGRLHPSKSIDLLLEAFAGLAANLATARLAIVGPDDGDEGRLRSLAERLAIQDRVTFVGFVDEETKWSAYRDADVVVVPSFFGFPIVFPEAWTCARPIVATDRHDGLSFFDGRAGLLSKPDGGSLRDALASLARDPVLRRRLGDEARAMVEKEFTWAAVASRVTALYAEVAR